jgi:hypothetical protein
MRRKRKPAPMTIVLTADTGMFKVEGQPHVPRKTIEIKPRERGPGRPPSAAHQEWFLEFEELRKNKSAKFIDNYLMNEVAKRHPELSPKTIIEAIRKVRKTGK